MGDYSLKNHMFSIDMGGCDIVLGSKFLQTLGPISRYFGALYMSSNKNRITTVLKELQMDHHIIFFHTLWKRFLKRAIKALCLNSMSFNILRPISTHSF